MKNIHKVLVVDDSKLARLTLTRLLRERNLEVVEAGSVADGLEILNSEAIDAVFMDVMMPEKDGFEGLNIIKNDPRLKHIPCSMYSGDLSIEAQKKAIDSGAQAYLFKPASGDGIDHVLQALESNIIAEDMRRFTQEGANEAPHDAAQSEMLATLENRTRNLARIVTRERKENEAVQKILEEKINSFLQDMHNVKEQSEHYAREEVERKRTESELRAQLKSTRGKVQTLGIVSIVAALVAIVSLVMQFV